MERHKEYEQHHTCRNARNILRSVVRRAKENVTSWNRSNDFDEREQTPVEKHREYKQHYNIS